MLSDVQTLQACDLFHFDSTHTAGTATGKGETGWRKGIRIFTQRKCSHLNTITAALASWEE